MLSIRTDIRVRPARVMDAKAIAAVHKDSWLHSYRGILPHAELSSMVRRRGASWWLNAIAGGETVIVLELKSSVVGYATCGRVRAGRTGDGEVYELYISPTYQGLGLGEALFEGCRGVLDAAGYRRLIVWVLAENERAINFYWARGGRQVGEGTHRFGCKTVRKLAFAWD